MILAFDDHLVLEGLDLVSQKYGPQTLKFYHGRKHTEMVISCAIELSKLAIDRGLITDSEGNRFIRAAAWHDVEQDLGRGLDEDESARLLACSMRASSYSHLEIRLSMRLIHGTKAVWSADGVMHQEAEGKSYLEQLMADADLCAIGVSPAMFVDMSGRLIREIAKKFELTDAEWKKGWLGQAKFLTGRRFLTQEAQDLMGQMIPNNLQIAKILAS